MQTVQTAPIVRQLKYALKANASRNVYIGSGEKARGLQRSPLAMPYELRVVNWKDDAERDEKIGQYKIWLWRIMKDEKNPRHESVWSALRRLRPDSILLCYCYPRNCHGHAIVAAWKWAVANGKIDAPRQEPPLKQPTVPAAQTEERMMADARRNQKELSAEDKAELDRRFPDKPAAVIAPGPLDMVSVLERLHTHADPSLDGISKEVLAAHGIYDRPSTLLNPPPPCMDHEECTKEDIAYIMDRRLDEEILAAHVTTCPDCDAPKYIHLAHHHADCTCEGCHYHYENNANNTEDTLMADDVPYNQTPTTTPAPTLRKKRQGITYSVADPYYNEVDDVTADLTDLYTFDASFDRESIALAS